MAPPPKCDCLVLDSAETREGPTSTDGLHARDVPIRHTGHTARLTGPGLKDSQFADRVYTRVIAVTDGPAYDAEPRG